MKTIILSTITLVLLVGCSSKFNHPIQLKHNLVGENISINILSEKKRYVPKDKTIKDKNWHYKQINNNKHGYFFDNEKLIETFYLAHHATHIYIRGNQKRIMQFKKYFINNQVTANIELIPLHGKNQITIDYFHITPSLNKELNQNAKNNKELLRAASQAIEIPLNN